MVPLLPADVAEGSVVRDVLGDVGDLVDRMVVLEDLKEGTTQDISYITSAKMLLYYNLMHACMHLLPDTLTVPQQWPQNS